MTKNQLIEAMLQTLQAEHQILLQAAIAARDAAISEESKAEDQHDTRGLEASYLAGAQAQRVTEIQRLITFFKFFPIRDWRADEEISIGALVEVKSQGKNFHYFISPQGGGWTVKVEGVSVQVITPQSPLGEALMGRKKGEELEVENGAQIREYEVVKVG